MLVKVDDIDFLSLVPRHVRYHVVIIPDAELQLLPPKSLIKQPKRSFSFGCSDCLNISLPSPWTEEIVEFRMIFSTQRVVRPWHRMPREAVTIPSLEVFKSSLDEALSNLG